MKDEKGEIIFNFRSFQYHSHTPRNYPLNFLPLGVEEANLYGNIADWHVLSSSATNVEWGQN